MLILFSHYLWVFYVYGLFCIFTLYPLTCINSLTDSNRLSFGFSMYTFISPLQSMYVLFLILALWHWKDFQDTVKWQWGYPYLLRYSYLRKKFSSISRMILLYIFFEETPFHTKKFPLSIFLWGICCCLVLFQSWMVIMFLFTCSFAFIETVTCFCS